MIRMTAMVSSIVRLLRRAPIDADTGVLSNGCATSPSVWPARRLIVIMQVFAAIFCTAELARAQETAPPQDQSSSTSEHGTASAFGWFLTGAAVGLGAHESG